MTVAFQPLTDTIIALLGGREVITSPVRTSLDLVQAAQAGVPVAAVRHLQKHLRFTNREMSEALSISESTLARREQAHGNLTRDEGEKAIQLSAVVAKGLEVFEKEQDFHRWLQLENPALGGWRPQMLLSSALGREQVREVLGRIQWGIFS
jgi:putative toxin-antitoxin system antitoxin component (TIGR02293 family)